MYKGVTDFRGIHNHDLLELSTFQKSKLSKLELVSDIYPEYYILKVNYFNDLAKDSLDEWVYFLKNSEIMSEFKAKGLKNAAVELDIQKLSKEDREKYQNYIEDKRVLESSSITSWAESEMKGRNEGIVIGIEQGIMQGIEQGKIQFALEMIKDSESNDKIRKYTGLTDEEIVELRKK